MATTGWTSEFSECLVELATTLPGELPSGVTLPQKAGALNTRRASLSGSGSAGHPMLGMPRLQGSTISESMRFGCLVSGSVGELQAAVHITFSLEGPSARTSSALLYIVCLHTKSCATRFEHAFCQTLQPSLVKLRKQSSRIGKCRKGGKIAGSSVGGSVCPNC